MTPLIFAVLSGSIGFCFSIFWPLFWGIVRGKPWMGEAVFSFFRFFIDSFAPFSAFWIVGLALVYVLFLVLLTVTIFIFSVISHFLLFLVRGSKNGYEATFRVMSYSGAASLFYVIPFIGGVVAGLWNIVLFVLGLSRAHDIGVLRVVFAIIFLPIILLIIFTLVIIGSLGIIPALLLNY